MQDLFVELVQLAIGSREYVSRNLLPIDWNRLLEEAQRQAIVGVMMPSIEKLSQNGLKPPLSILYEWIGISEHIKAQNLLLNRRCVEITKLFADAGFRSCILKGQGNALMYPNPLMRNSGDIDLWVEGSRDEIREFVTSRSHHCQESNLHIEFPIFNDVIIEVHYKPRSSIIPKYDKRLQAWIQDNSEKQFSNRVLLSDNPNDIVNVPTVEFNVVQQLSHIMGHFFVEGIGLRHFIDYYFVLKALRNEKCSVDFEKLFDFLGMLKFAQAVMWVEKNVLGIDDAYLLTVPNERLGKVILNEIKEGGNFGQYDHRYIFRHKGYLIRGLVDSYRLLKLAYFFPEESIWKIVKKIENQKWKWFHHVR